MRLYTSLGEVHSIRKTPKEIRYYIEVYTQPLLDRLHYKAYHWYDMHIFRIPGMRKLERGLYEARCWWRARHGKETILVMPWFASQDCHCYELSIKNRVTLVTLDLTYEQYVKVRSVRYPSRGTSASPSRSANPESRGA
jgi:hypothetical protein